MRIYTGSESMLRELKMSTPKEVKNSQFQNIERDFTTSKDVGSKKNLTSHNSQDTFYHQ